jgi:hypothetical protein
MDQFQQVINIDHWESIFQTKMKFVNETCTTLIQDSVRAFHAIDFSQMTLWLSVGTVVLSPLFWVKKFDIECYCKK